MRQPPDLIAMALAEDIGEGDVTTAYFTSSRRRAMARIIAREPCVLAGVAQASETFRRVDPELRVVELQSDGAELLPSGIALEISGSAASLLTAERTALNFLQHLSGIATQTRLYVEAVKGTRAKILDTRKTLPGWRQLEKNAVVAGGGANHRMGLYDMVMVKDNHLASGAGLAELHSAIARLKADRPEIRVELEADTLAQVKNFLTLKDVDVILLDNMNLDELREAVTLGEGKGVAFEASGGITIEAVRFVAETGVDYISVGALTHSVRAVDLAMEIVEGA
ncbi:carboxylating nicotinate-nucleotide diphosphorylase [soil metagenome]